MFGRKKAAETKPTIEHGSKVEYLVGEDWLPGTVHGIREIDGDNGASKVIGYLVDNGEVASTQEVVTPKGEDNIVVDQPVQVEVTPENIRLAE